MFHVMFSKKTNTYDDNGDLIRSELRGITNHLSPLGIRPMRTELTREAAMDYMHDLAQTLMGGGWQPYNIDKPHGGYRHFKYTGNTTREYHMWIESDN